MQGIRQSSNMEESFPEITSRLLNLLQVVHVSIYKLDKSVSNEHRTGISGQIIAEAIAPNCDDCSQIHVENILREEYQWGEETSREIIGSYTAGLTRCDLNLAEVFAGKTYLLVPIVLSVEKTPLWGFLTIHQCTALNEKTFHGSWDQDDVLLLQQIAMQIEIALQKERHITSLREQVREAEQSYSTLHGWMEQYRCLVEEIPNVSYVSPIANTPEFAYISPQLKELLGIPPSKWNAGFFNSWEEYVHPDDRDRVQQEVRHTIATEVPFCCEYRMITSDGKIIWVRDNAYIGLAPDGKTKVLRGSAFDISDRKESELRFKGIFDNTFQFVGLLSTDGIFLEANQTALNFGDITRDEVIGKPIWETYWLSVSEDEQNRVKEAVRQAALGEFVRYEMDIFGAGRIAVTIDFSIRPLKDESGRVILLIPEGRDISELKAIEKSLRKSEAMLEKAQQITKLGNWEWNIFDNEIIWSKELFNIFGQDPALGTPDYEEHLLDFVHEDRENLDRLVRKAINNGESYRIELQILKSDKPDHYIEAIGHPEYDDNQQVSKLYGTVQDISDRKTVEAKIAAASLAEAANLAKTEFLAVMSHELRTPMNAVIGMTDILLNTPLSPEQQGYVEMIQRGGEMLLSVISNILDFSRIESGEFELEERLLDLRQCIKEVLELMTFYKAEKILKLDALIGIDFPQQIMGDYARLRQILINLVSNAIKFTENGKVVIEASSQLLDQSTDTYELRFDVRDTGIGISDEQITKLFKAFSQADKSITRQYGGTGLGLVICKQLCELMGGNISVTSTVGVGSTFSFSIVGQAIANNPEAIAPNLNDKKILSRLDQSFANQYPFRILVVEDNPVNQEILLLMLGKLGYTPQASSNGIEALTNLVEQSYDVIIIDIEMPIMDGLTASRKIRQLPNRTPWIVGLSANAFTESREIALAAGMNDYLTKPLQVEGLIAALERVTLSSSQESKYQALDVKALEALGNAVSKEHLPNLIDLYLEHAAKAIASMHQALSDKDIEIIDAKNHSLKGGTETFGAIQLSKSCQELQLVCKRLLSSQSSTDEDIEAIVIILNKMESEFKLVSQAFQKYLDI